MANRLYALKKSHINLDHISVVGKVRTAEEADQDVEFGYCFSVQVAGIDTEFVVSFETEDEASKERSNLIHAIGEYVARY